MIYATLSCFDTSLNSPLLLVTADAFDIMYSVLKLFRVAGNEYEHSIGLLFQETADPAIAKLVGSLERVVGSRSTTSFKNAWPLYKAAPHIREFLEEHKGIKNGLNQLEQAVLTATQSLAIKAQYLVMAVVYYAAIYPVFMVSKFGELKKANALQFGPLARNIDKTIKVSAS